MKYFIDTEFHEGFHKPLFGKNRHFIDLISIGIVSEDGREYYAISKDFDIKAAWNSYQIEETGKLDLPGINRSTKKVYWLRENVLKPIFYELNGKDINFHDIDRWFTLNNLRNIIHDYCKSNEQIAEEIKIFCKSGYVGIDEKAPNLLWDGGQILTRSEPEFYGYYCNYDWVVFCSLFGKMINLPKKFPMYCKDLKQMLDEKSESITQLEMTKTLYSGSNWEVISELPKLIHSIEDYTTDMKVQLLKSKPNYPKQTDEHNALADAKWNKELYTFLITL